MAAQGLNSMFPMDRLSVMGFVEPLKRLPELLRIRGAVYRHFRDNPPDLFLGIDSPDFNLRLERKLRDQGIVTAHLVSPSVWAWRQGRIRKIKRAIDLMLCLFPFETNIYEENDIPVEFVGHPLADEISGTVDRQAARRELGLPVDDKILAILPGSRGGEVRMLAPLFLQAATLVHKNTSQLSVVIPAANEARKLELEEMLGQYPQLSATLMDGRSREVMAAADAVLLASGTATLEATLLKRPMVVAYRLARLTWFLVRRLVKTPFAGLPNILAGRSVVPELIQDDATPEAVAAALQPLVSEDDAAAQQLQVFEGIHRDLSRDYARRAAAALDHLVKDRERQTLE
jgi:lipid-A-disaccharide synthase